MAWLPVISTPDDYTDRLQVAGGWIYRVSTMVRSQGDYREMAVATAFVPDAAAGVTEQLADGLGWVVLTDTPTDHTASLGLPGGTLFRNSVARQFQGYSQWFTSLSFASDAAGGGGGGTTPPATTTKQAFYFASLSGALTPDSTWRGLNHSGAGMTGDPTLATVAGTGLLLNENAVVQIQIWTQFAAAGDGTTQVGIMLDETAYGGANSVRGQLQLLTEETMVGAAYDGWLSAGAVLRAGANAANAATVQGGYITACLFSR